MEKKRPKHSMNPKPGALVLAAVLIFAAGFILGAQIPFENSPHPIASASEYDPCKLPDATAYDCDPEWRAHVDQTREQLREIDANNAIQRVQSQVWLIEGGLEDGGLRNATPEIVGGAAYVLYGMCSDYIVKFGNDFPKVVELCDRGFETLRAATEARTEGAAREDAP